MIDLAGVDQIIALVPAEMDPVPLHLSASRANPAIGSVSRCWRVVFTNVTASVRHEVGYPVRRIDGFAAPQRILEPIGERASRRASPSRC